MCLTIPAKVVSVKGGRSGSPIRNLMVEDFQGRKVVKALMIDELKPGDWVLYSFDTAVRKIGADDAREILELLAPRAGIDVTGLKTDFVRILKACHTRMLEKREIIRLLNASDQSEIEALCSEANTIRQANLKDFFCIHGIIEFSNHCVRECHYCGLRRGAMNFTRYRMRPQEIVDTVVAAVDKRGYKLIVLQSGDDFLYTDDMLVDILKGIKQLCQVFIFMSVGERSLDCYKKMKEAGASGVLCRFETSNETIYNTIHPGRSLKQRIELLKGIKELGYYLASGFLIGLPAQTVGDIADDILFMKSFGVNMVTVGPFVPCEETPLVTHPQGSAEMTLKVLAIARLLMPKTKIPVTTALETIESEEGRRLGLSSGANSLMFNLTPESYRNDYRIYPNKYHGNEAMWEKYGLSKESLSYKMLEKKMLEAFD